MNKEEKRKIEDLLDKLEISIATKGYKYWVMAIEMYLENENLLMGDIYKKIARSYQTTWSSVERAMGHSLERIEKKIQSYFGVTYKIVNITFLYLAVRNIKRGEWVNGRKRNVRNRYRQFKRCL